MKQFVQRNGGGQSLSMLSIEVVIINLIRHDKKPKSLHYQREEVLHANKIRIKIDTELKKIRNQKMYGLCSKKNKSIKSYVFCGLGPVEHSKK